ncbi:hypothetical protein [Anaerovibrio sp.]|uniref:hypothetical protein n=1 Tax=Anaerovibrio sp. TaxID=1872532 RepID=UPI003F184080
MGMIVLWLLSMLVVKFFFDIKGMLVYTFLTDFILFFFGIAGLITMGDSTIFQVWFMFTFGIGLLIFGGIELAKIEGDPLFTSDENPNDCK